MVLSVRDNGTGMDPGTLGRIFEPFFTTKGERGGTGLGLAQVYGFTQQVGGEVRVRNLPGAGAQIELLLPCPSEQASRDAEPGRAAAP